MSQNRTLNRIYPYLLIAPALFFTIGVSLYPTLYSFYLSLNRTRRGQLEFVGFRNFEIIWGSDTFWNALRLTGIFGGVFVVLVMFFGFLLALAFNKGIRFAGIYMTIIFLPWMLSEIVVGVMWRWMFVPNVGILQSWLTPIFGENMLGDGNQAMAIVIVANLWRALAFGMLLLLAGLQTIPKELNEAAQIDGANKWDTFWRVTWPLMLPTTQVTVVFLSIQAINTVGMFLSITGGGPGRSTEVLALHMYREAIEFFNFGYGAALSVMMFFINVILAIVYITGLRSQNVLD